MKEIAFNLDNEFLALRGQLKSYLYRLSANKTDAEDLTQDAYIKVKEKIDTYKGDSSFKTWVFAIATNLARDNRRVKNRWAPDAQDKCKEAVLSDKACETRMINAFISQDEKRFELIEHINYCFSCLAKNLSLEQQIAIILKEFYFFDRKEIASILDKTEASAKYLLSAARKKLQERYEYRCAMINKNGICYQCAELNDYMQENPDSAEKIAKCGLSPDNGSRRNLDIRVKLISKINPLDGPGANLEDTILQILREAIKDH